MKIGIIGIGALTLELASRSAQNGYEVLVHNPRGNCLIKESLKKVDTLKMVSIEEAASAEIILLFLPMEDIETVIGKLPDMSGKIILHTGNLIFNPTSDSPMISNSLSCQLTAAMLPEARIVKLFNPILLENFDSDCFSKKREKIFFMSGDSYLKNMVGNFLKKLQFSPVDLFENKQKSLATTFSVKKANLLNRKSF